MKNPFQIVAHAPKIHGNVTTLRLTRTTLIAAACLIMSSLASYAGSATWSTDPATGDWNTATNWIPNTVPDSPSDVATFGASNATAVSITGTDIDLDSAVFNSGASPYTITVQDHSLNISGAGIVNNSGVMQSFVASTTALNQAHISFFGSASAGEMTTFGTTNGFFVFSDSASAGSATFSVTCEGCIGGAGMSFGEGTTAANATINVSGDAYILLFGASGGNATFNLTNGASYLEFSDGTADHATVNCTDANGVLFVGTASAGEGTFSISGGMSGARGGSIYFGDTASAGSAVFNINGGTATRLGTSLIFH
jgi:hypothetical protein